MLQFLVPLFPYYSDSAVYRQSLFRTRTVSCFCNFWILSRFYLRLSFFSHLPSFADCLLTLSTVRRKHITDQKTLDFTPFRFCWLREIVARKYRLSRSRTFSCLKIAVQIVTINSLFETLPFLRDFSISRVDSFVVSISRHCRLNRSVGIRVYFPSKSDYRSNHEIALPRSKSVRDSSRKFFFLLSFISLD